MHRSIHVFASIFAGLLLLHGCQISSTYIDENYQPSIAKLSENQTLIMDYSACHWGCIEGKIRFLKNKAVLSTNYIELTQGEIEILDAYFQMGKPLDEGWRCSLPINIEFGLTEGRRTVGTKKLQTYPCNLGEQVISPGALVKHLQENSEEIPFWRERIEE